MNQIKHSAIAIAALALGVQLPALGQICGGSWSQDFVTTGAPSLAYGPPQFVLFDEGDGPALFAGGHNRKWNFNRWEPLANPLGLNPVVADGPNGPAIYSFRETNLEHGLYRWERQSMVPFAVMPYALSPGYLCNVWHITLPMYVYADDNGGTWFIPRYYDACHGGIYYHRISTWNASTWQQTDLWVMPRPTAITIDDQNVYAAVPEDMYCEPGEVSVLDRNTGQVNRIAQFIDGNCDASIEAMVVFDDGTGEALYVGGQFVEINGTPIEGIARWDGSRWSMVGAGIEGSVSALQVWNHNGDAWLIASGVITSAGGNPVSNIALWDGTDWHPLGSGADGKVEHITVSDVPWRRSIFFSGLFTRVGGLRSPFMAEWVCYDCRANCDDSTGQGVLDVFDFLCFQNSFVNAEPYACDCDMTTGPGVCDISDFICFQDAFVAGCP